MMDTKHIERAWLDYRAQVLPSAAPAVQVIEVRRGFYAGAWALYMLQMGGFTREAGPTEADERMMIAIRNELVRFNEAVKAGTA